ncbi:DnaB-like helicase C-terminal domain-containing protein, partial [Roseiconus lacunae]
MTHENDQNNQSISPIPQDSDSMQPHDSYFNPSSRPGPTTSPANATSESRAAKALRAAQEAAAAQPDDAPYQSVAQPTASIPRQLAAPTSQPLSEAKQQQRDLAQKVLELLPIKGPWPLPEGYEQVEGSVRGQLERLTKPHLFPIANEAWDSVTLYCVLRALEMHVPEKVQHDATYKLGKSLQSYRHLLNQSLDHELVRCVELQIQAARFCNDENSNLNEDLDEYLRLSALANPETYGFPTGISSLDAALNGGLSGLVFLAGDKATGKTHLTLHTAVNCIKHDPRTFVLIYSLDMEKIRIIDRLACHQLQVHPVNLRELKASEEGRSQIDAALRNGVTDRVKVCTRKCEPEDICNSDGERVSERTVFRIPDVHEAISEIPHNARLLLVIDLFQKIPVPTGVPFPSLDAYRLDLLEQVKHHCTQRFGVSNFAIVVTSEMRKKDSNRDTKSIQRDDLKGDGRMASDADT